jgi:hypothetical protein
LIYPIKARGGPPPPPGRAYSRDELRPVEKDVYFARRHH